MQQTIHGDCTELTAFVCEHLSVCLHNPFSHEAFCSIHHPQRSMHKISCFLGHCVTFFSGKIVQVSPFFASVLLQIELNTQKLQSIQYNTFRDQESGTKFNICKFSVFEYVTNFFFIVACSLSSSPALFFASLSYIGGGSSISTSETYAAEMFSLFTFKTFYKLPFAFEARECRATPWILTGETSMLSKVELSFFFGGSYSNRSSSDTNSSGEFCLGNFCHALICRWFS